MKLRQRNGKYELIKVNKIVATYDNIHDAYAHFGLLESEEALEAEAPEFTKPVNEVQEFEDFFGLFESPGSEGRVA